MIGILRRLGPLTPPAPLSHLTPDLRERGEIKKQLVSAISLLSRKGGREVGEEGWGGEGPEAAETPLSSTLLDVKAAL